MKRLTITASGRVQGVFFRSSVKSFADSRKLFGYTKNFSGNGIEIVAEGEENDLRKLLDWCYRGSLLSRVDALAFQWSDEPTSSFTSFTIDRDGHSLLYDQARSLKHLYKNIAGSIDIVPKHLVIIPDGNRRWATDRNMAPWQGHREGMQRTIQLLKDIRKYGIRYCTLWGFSTENWSRDPAEVKKLMWIFQKTISDLRKEAHKNKISFHHFGRKDRLPASLAKKIDDLESETKDYDDYHLGLALDYGGRDELLRAIEKIQLEGGKVSETRLTEVLDTKNFPDPDLMIRTGGEQRLSGMMPWQSTYAELYFTPKYFPDFDSQELSYALADFADRSRRFGK